MRSSNGPERENHLKMKMFLNELYLISQLQGHILMGYKENFQCKAPLSCVHGMERNIYINKGTRKV